MSVWWDGIVAITAVVALGFSIYNFVDARRSPERADQRRYREELRNVVYPLKRQCESASSGLKLGDEIAVEVPPEITHARQGLDRLEWLISSTPLKNKIRLLSISLHSIEVDWMMVNHHASSEGHHTDQSAAYAELAGYLKDAKNLAASQGLDTTKAMSATHEAVEAKKHARMRAAREGQLRESLEAAAKQAADIIQQSLTLDRE